MVGVPVVSSRWGLAQGVVTAVLGAAVLAFLVSPRLDFVSSDSPVPPALIILLAVALVLSSIVTAMARRLLRTEGVAHRAAGSLRSFGAGARGDRLRRSSWRRSLAGRIAQRSPLRESGALPVHADSTHTAQRRVWERVVISVGALLRAARDREGIVIAVER